MWRYRELLPIDGEPTVGTQVGFTPLVKADRLAKALGIRELYIKNDTVNYPTLVLQGSRRLRGAEPRARAGLQSRGLRLDRQSRELRRGQCGQRRA